MRVLILTASLPFSADDGGKLAVLGTARALARIGVTVGIAAMSSGGVRRAASPVPEFAVWTAEVRTGIRPVGMLRSLLQLTPYSITKLRSRRYWDTADTAVREFCPDVLHVECLQMAEHGLRLAREHKLPAVLRLQNADSVLMERYAATRRSILARSYGKRQARLLREYERRTLPEFPVRVAITDQDARQLIEATGCSIDVIPIGIDVQHYSLASTKAHEVFGTVSYIASMDWLPNVDSACWFMREVLPLIRAQFPGAATEIVGRNPPPSVLRLARRAGVKVVGTVPDVRQWYARSSVVVVPTRVGSGLRVKVLEAMAMGKPVVSTSVGCEGIEGLRDRANVLIADAPRDFADAVVELLRSDRLRNAIGAAGRSLVQACYTWDSVADSFCRLYESAVKHGSERRVL